MKTPRLSRVAIDLMMMGASEMAQRVRHHDWAANPLGPIERWPHSLLIAVSICLHSRFPMFVWWGPNLINIHNDSYVPMLGARHPAALGAPAQAVWSEIWPDVGPQAEAVMKQGQSTWNECVYLRMERHGYPEDTWFTWSYSPIRDELGTIRGLFCAVTEDTSRVLAQRQRDELADARMQAAARDRFMTRVDDAVRKLSDPDEVVLTVATLLGQHVAADRCAYAAVEEDEDTMNLTGNYRRSPDVASIVGRLRFSDFGAEVLHLMRTGQPFVVDDVDRHTPAIGNLEAYRATQIKAVICVPLHKRGRFVAAMAVHCASARRWTPDEVELVQVIANRCWESLERARVTRSLQESENRFRALVHASSDVVFRVNPDWSEMLLLQGEELDPGAEQPTRQWMSRYVPPGDHAPVAAAIGQAIRAKQTLELEHRVCRNDGSIGWAVTRAVPILGSGGEVAEWFGAATDVTARKLAEQTLRASETALKEADRRKDEFLAMLAHELRNPLAPISNALQVLQKSPDGGVRARAQQVIDRQLHQLIRLVDDLLDVSRITRGKVELRREPVPLWEIVRNAVETVSPLIEQRGHELRVAVARDIWVMADRARMAQVFGNVLNNAAKYTVAGGRIEVDARVAADAIVTISDNGIGIPPDQLARVFDLFSQIDSSLERSQGGLGIGLTIVKTIVEMHGGSVRACSDGISHGTTIEVRLPACRASAPSVACEQSEPLGPLRLLVVDDNRESAQTLATMLELEGHTVRLAYDASSALDLLTSFRPHAALLDIGMPGMSGFELCKVIRSRSELAGVTLIAQTGYGEPHHLVQSHAAGFQHHLVKPLEPWKLRAVLADVAAKCSAGAPSAVDHQE